MDKDELIFPCLLINGEDIEYKTTLLNKIKHIGKKYYSGHIRWLLQTKKGKYVSCDKCGNIANGVIGGTLKGYTYNIPMCEKHLAELYFKDQGQTE